MAWRSKTITDPVLLVQDNSLLRTGHTTIGITTVNVHAAQRRRDRWSDRLRLPVRVESFVIGIEGAASGSTMKGSRLVRAPRAARRDTALVQVNTDFLPSLTGRVGYAFDNVLLYARGGAALGRRQVQVSGTFTGDRTLSTSGGWTTGSAGLSGGGVEWAFTRNWSAGSNTTTTIRHHQRD